MLGVVPALCFEGVLGILTDVGFFVLGPEFGWRDSQWSCFGENSCCLTAPPQVALELVFTLCFVFHRDFFGHWEAQCLGRGLFMPKTLGRSCFPAFGLRGLFLSGEWQPV